MVYTEYLVPAGLHNDTDFLENELVNKLLHAIKISQGYALKDLLEAYYFRPWQMGSLEHMTPGAVDVSVYMHTSTLPLFESHVVGVSALIEGEMHMGFMACFC